MIISTLPTYPGKKVVKDLGVIYAYDDALRVVRGGFNMDKPLEFAQKYLTEKAKERGANAVLGVSVFLKVDVPFLFGTAVILEDE